MAASEVKPRYCSYCCDEKLEAIIAAAMTSSPVASSQVLPERSSSSANRQPSMATSEKVRRPAAESGRRSRSMPISKPIPKAVAKALTGSTSSGTTKLMRFLFSGGSSVKLSHATSLRNRSRCRQRFPLRRRKAETVSRPARPPADLSHAGRTDRLPGYRTGLGGAGAGRSVVAAIRLEQPGRQAGNRTLRRRDAGRKRGQRPAGGGDGGGRRRL